MSSAQSVISALRHRLVLTGVAIAAALAFGLAAPVHAAEPLVSAQWLKQNLAAPDLVVLDIRSALDGGGAAAHAKAHIPGAVHSDYDKGGWRVARGGIPFMLPSAAQLEALISDLGIDEDSHVVIVPAGVHVLDFGAAARVYWTLKVAGHEKVSILDGGFAAWRGAGYAVELGVNRPTAKLFSVTFDSSRLIELAEVERIEKSHEATLLDARPASFFAGKEKAPAAKAYGHIPGALNLDSAAFYDGKANRLKPTAALAALAASLPEGPIVSYCNTGHWAATNWFVLSELLGRKDVRLYYGSMVEWTADPQRPVESARTRLDDIKKALGL
jgi:thiosulfate/3-mercaptopyruvate sulfurtransferase